MVGCTRSSAPPSTEESVVHTTAASSSPPTPSGFGPLSYFQQACSRCHGPNGANYGDTFGADLSDTDLHQMVEDMAAGPGGKPLEGESLNAQVAFHRSLVDRHPFVIVTHFDQRNLQGETIPGAMIQITVNGKSYDATVSGHRWTIQFPPDIQLSQIQVSATRQDKKTEIDLSRQTYSHIHPVSQVTPSP